ncbi:hypothetical protein BDW59DRAFT_91086 [Aspergillus cavernicola]|uniref:Uncharacterized protein n=1 Tax=Aspergillus cavernicola TaxID=176166 RepID=A0ABR4I869_9EURO
MATPKEAVVSKKQDLEDDRLCAHSDSLEATSSSGSLIYDALRASSSTGEETAPQTQAGNNRLERVDSRMAANVAMFCSLSSESAPCHPRRNTDKFGRPPRAYMMADKLRLASTGDVVSWSPPERLHPSFVEQQQQSSTGFSPSDIGQSSPRFGSGADTTGSSKWPVSVKSPVSPALPNYPPPVRSPTPPGLPTFGSNDARVYDFRVGARPPIPNRSESLLRRLFQRASHSPSPQHDQHNQQIRTRVYAEDGTAVLGNFPPRQSGHGTNALKGLDDHPFHQRNLSLAQCDGMDAGHGEVASGGLNNTEPRPSPRGYDTDEDEATLSWLEDRLRSQSPSPQSAAAPRCAPNSTLSVPGFSTKKADSYHTCVSGIQDAILPIQNERLGTSSFVSGAYPVCLLETTQSAVPTATQETTTAQEASGKSSNDSNQTDRWLQLRRRVKSMLCCCPGLEEEQGNQSPNISTNEPAILTTNTVTQDTFLTARDCISDESQHPRADAAAESQSGP